MATMLEQIIALAEQLSPEKQRAALRYIQKLAENEGIVEPELPPGTPGSFYLKFSFHPEDAERIEQAIMEAQKPELPPGGTVSALRNLHFSMSKEDIDAMERAIMEDCERF